MFVGKMEGALQVGAIQAQEDWSPSPSRIADHLERAIAKQRVGPVNLQELPCDAILDELDGAVIPKVPDVIDARRGHRDKLRLYVQRRVLRLAYRRNRSRKSVLPRNVRQNHRHRGRHGCAAARCSGRWPNLSRNGYDRLLLLFVMMALLASFSPNSTPPVKQIRNAGELHEYLAGVPSLALADGQRPHSPAEGHILRGREVA